MSGQAYTSFWQGFQRIIHAHSKERWHVFKRKWITYRPALSQVMFFRFSSRSRFFKSKNNVQYSWLWLIQIMWVILVLLHVTYAFKSFIDKPCQVERRNELDKFWRRVGIIPCMLHLRTNGSIMWKRGEKWTSGNCASNKSVNKYVEDCRYPVWFKGVSNYMTCHEKFPLEAIDGPETAFFSSTPSLMACFHPEEVTSLCLLK